MTVTKKDVGYFARIIGVLLVITMCVALLLAVVNMITKDTIAENERAQLEEAIGELFKDAKEPKPKQLNVKLNTKNDEIDSAFNALYLVTDGDAPIGFYADVTPVGFKGGVSMLVGIDLTGKVTGIQILTHSETVGIGDKIEDESYLKKFKDADSIDAIEKIDTISQATYSSTAVKNGVKTAIAAYNAYVGGAGK